MSDDDALDRRFPRRLLLGGSAAAAALAAAQAVRPTPAAAAPVTDSWKLGGNTVSTDGTNWVGTKNVAPLIFKTGRTGKTPAERMRLSTLGRLGIGTTDPKARLDVRGNEPFSVQGIGSAGVGVRGESTSGNAGVLGVTTTGDGVSGSSGYAGVRGVGDSYGGIFYGNASGSFGLYTAASYRGLYASGGTDGVYGSGGSVGVTGQATNANGTGVLGAAPDGASKGVWGTGGQYSVYGNGGATAGVRGDSGYVGTWGEGTSYGAFGNATGTSGVNYGLFGQTASPDGWALYAQGNARVTGTLSKSAGSFRIDHPLDPTRRWLSHSFVESPDMMNVYNGNVVLGADGTAVVELPAYFGALNRDVRYQLTCIGGYAPVYVSQEVEGNRFGIAGGRAGLTVSWQVTGVRQDDYAKAHPIVVDTPKTGADLGTRQFPPAGARTRPAAVGPAGDVPTGPPPAAAVPTRP